ncbi:MAG: IS66 family insertion sequence element accessory protein TnpA [Pirellula sp.]
MAQCERSNLPVAQFCQSIGCSVTSFYQWKRKLSASPKQSSFLRVQTFEPTKDSIEIKLPSGISILVPVWAVDSISAIHNERRVPGNSEQRSHPCQQIIPCESGTDPEDPLRSLG